MTVINAIGNLRGMHRATGSAGAGGADATHQAIHDALKAAIDAIEGVSGAATSATLVVTGNASVGGTFLSTGVLTTTAGAVIGTDLEINGALNHDGTTVGFYAATPTTQLTGVAVSAAGIHAALVTLGLITA